MAPLLGFPGLCVFTDTFHRYKPDSDAQLGEKYNPIPANKWPCSSNGPTFGHKHNLSFGQTCSYWQISSAQVVGRSWWCTFPIFQSAKWLHWHWFRQIYEEKSSPEHTLNGVWMWIPAQKREMVLGFACMGLTFKRKGWSLNQMTTQTSLSSSNILSTTLGQWNSLGLG